LVLFIQQFMIWLKCIELDGETTSNKLVTIQILFMYGVVLSMLFCKSQEILKTLSISYLWQSFLLNRFTKLFSSWEYSKNWVTLLPWFRRLFLI
jgi:hypothetical protein